MGDARGGLEHRALTLSVRPPRVAVFLRESDGWQHSAIRVLESFSRCWGGAGNIIVPFNGDGVSEVFWSILRRFDPDRLGYFRPDARSRELANPEEYRRWVEEHVRQLREEHGLGREQALRFVDSRQGEEGNAAGPPRQVEDEATLWLAPYVGRRERAISLRFFADRAPPYRSRISPNIGTPPTQRSMTSRPTGSTRACS
ncbi:MAG: hypothetical protein ACOY3Y_17085 [Acidobacteriota bacterium]